jgi:hypothetical protein
MSIGMGRRARGRSAAAWQGFYHIDTGVAVNRLRTASSGFVVFFFASQTSPSEATAFALMGHSFAFIAA